MLRKVRLEAARGHEFPEGSAKHGYELALPLSPDAALDRDFWLKHRAECSFRRFWGDEEAHGHLAHGGQGWRLVFDDTSGDAEVIVKAEAHRFIGGEYVSIKERDGVTRTFRIASVV
ncbi:MAG TPA: hypothetical protein VEI03_14330 [Stellaceae bacterium]|nr:hypothetical protein [Stellaceae bacterium]